MQRRHLPLAGCSQEQRWLCELRHLVVHDTGIRSAPAAGLDRTGEWSQRRSGRANLDLERIGWGHVLRRLLWHRRLAFPRQHDGNELWCWDAGSGHDLLLAGCGQENCWLSSPYVVVHDAAVPPAAPILASPANGATSVSAHADFTWNASAGATSYDVYLGTAAWPPLVTNTRGTSYAPGTLSATTYYWQVVAKNNGGSGELRRLVVHDTGIRSAAAVLDLTGERSQRRFGHANS